MAKINASEENLQNCRVLILGGCGFIGRHMVDYLVSNNLASMVRIVDKVPPQMAWLNHYHEELFSNPTVEFKSANLINPASCENVFLNNEGGHFDVVINLAAETKHGQSEPVYEEGILGLSVNCAKAAAKSGCKRFIEISSGHVYSSEKVPIRENIKPDPWTIMAKYKVRVEEQLAMIPKLNYMVVRPAMVYGIGDKQGIVPRLVVGAVYKHTGEMMKLLWHKGVKMHTVHVLDLCRAIWHVSLFGKSGEIYNVVDHGDTTQGKITDITSDIFNINHDYIGVAISTVVKMDMHALVEEINDKHMGPWADACNKDGIDYTPLTPYLHQELLYDKHLNLDGSKLESTGFTYLIPNLSTSKVQEILNDYIAMHIFPKNLMA